MLEVGIRAGRGSIKECPFLNRETAYAHLASPTTQGRQKPAGTSKILGSMQEMEAAALFDNMDITA
jgi:hypothetical protein